MTQKPRESIAPIHRLRLADEFTAIKKDGIALRGRHFVLLSLSVPGPSKVGFIASRKSVGGAVSRNRSRRRLREIVRRRWPRVSAEGTWLLFIATRRVLSATHEELVMDVERVLLEAGVLPRTGTM